MTTPKEFPPPVEQPFLSHLVELRDRLLKSVLVIIVLFLALISFSNDLYIFLAEPLIQSLPQGSSMIATGVIAPFLTPFKLTLVVSIFASIPFLLYQAWAFIAPGLYQNERRLAYPLIISSTILFYVGMLFAYYVVFPLVFGFMATTTPEGVSQAPDISMFLDFSIKLFFAFGIAFEVPIATILVIWAGLTTAESLAAKRPYIIVAAFVIGMLLTPPDVISQTLLALPMWVLFELGLIFSRVYKPKKDENSIGDAEDENAQATHYGDVEEEDHQEMSADEMDRELDQMEENDYDDDAEPHPEFEPLPEESSDESGKPKKDDDK
ncbi:twin-arginine translocase subunit TatC [Kaarinaea lacus]